jgi:4-alpha-glucanotransferase
MNADNWGVSYGYTDTEGVRHEASPATRRFILDALGAPEDPDATPADDGALVVNVDAAWSLNSGAEIRLENGETFRVDPGWSKPADFPLGYHSITIDGQPERAFIVTPVSCALPDSLRGWGWATQLYAMRSHNSWGMGDLDDLARLNRWSKARGAAYTLINPLHAATPTDGQQPSPYFPTSRVWRNPLFLNIESVPGWERVASDLALVAADGRALSRANRIDRTAIKAHKQRALETLWSVWPEAGDQLKASFAQWRAAEGTAIERYALYCALVEIHGGDIRNWPAHIRTAAASGVDQAAHELADRVSFHAWQQWLIEGQLQNANNELPVMTDLAIGVDRAGADAWVWPAAFCLSMSVGAPPDTFNTQGQNWGLPPFDPWRLRRLGYEPFIRTVRAAFRASGAVRMDHVMGLFRLWWIPEGADPSDGCYVYLPYRDLTGIVALESVRAGLGVVGEDLGTVEPYVTDELKTRQVLSYRLVQFEGQPTSELPEEAMAAITTHDLPTLAGMWTGADVLHSISADVVPNTKGFSDVRSSMATKANVELPDWPAVATSSKPADEFDELFAVLSEPDRQLIRTIAPLGSLDEAARVTGRTRDDLHTYLLRLADTLAATRRGGIDNFLTGALQDLASSPSRLIAATLDDALLITERPNLPGTTDSWPNWRIPLPMALEQLLEHPGVNETAAVLSKRGVSR